MAKRIQVVIDFRETFQRLFAVRSLCNLLDKAIPEAELEEMASLREIAEREGLDYNELSGEKLSLEADFRHWLPRFSAYSVIILLYSILETQLAAYAERVGTAKKASFRVTDIKGSGIEQSRFYLRRVSGLDAASDPSWRQLSCCSPASRPLRRFPPIPRTSWFVSSTAWNEKRMPSIIASAAGPRGRCRRCSTPARVCLLLKRHGQDICKRTKPKCGECLSVRTVLSSPDIAASGRRLTCEPSDSFLPSWYDIPLHKNGTVVRVERANRPEGDRPFIGCG